MKRFVVAAAAAALSYAVSTTAASPPPLALSLGAGGSYSIAVGGTPWFQSSDIAFAIDGVVYSASAQTLSLVGNQTSSGNDALGDYTRYTYAWNAPSAPSGGVMQTTFTVYASGSVIGFTTSFPSGSPSQASTPPAATGGLVTTFPAITAAQGAPASQLGALYQSPEAGNCGFLLSSTSNAFSSTTGGLLLISPPVAADAPSTSRYAVALASLDNQPIVRQVSIAVPGKSSAKALALGPGAELDLPAGFSNTVLLSASSLFAAQSSASTTTSNGNRAATTSPTPSPSRADWGMPPGGTNDALYTLGDALLALHNKSRPAMNFDRIHSTLGYSTCGAYFYNPCDCGVVGISPNLNATCPPDNGQNPFRLPNCNTYEDTLLQVHAGLVAAKIPYGHMLLDSFWYGENIFGGVKEWEDDPALMAEVLTFPHGLGKFASALGDGVVLWAHNGRWQSVSPYMKEYPFAGEMPQGPALWQHLFSSNAQDWKLRTIKQDHVGEQIAAAGTITNASQVSSWLSGMGEAATANGVSVEYCCSPPLVLLNSLNVPAASSARSSPDYVQRARQTALNLPNYQWANAAESAFHYSIGLMPDKDTFFSNTTERQHGGDGKPSAFWPSFYNWTEVNPIKHALSAVMCGGPVAPSDLANATNATLVWALMRGDGVILRPSRPHTAIDAELRSMMFGGWIVGGEGQEVRVRKGELAASTESVQLATDPADSPLTSTPDASYPNNGRGEVYSTVSLIPAVSAAGMGGGKLVSEVLPVTPLSRSETAACVRYTIVSAAQVSVPVNLSAADLAYDSLALETAACVANGGSWVAFDWDLSTFTPLGGSSVAAYPIFNSASPASADYLEIPVSVRPDYDVLPRLSVVAPILGGWVVLGEGGKLLPISPQRITSLLPSGVSGGVAISLVGAAGETVNIWACPFTSFGTACSQAAASFPCTIGSSGSATLSLPSGSCSASTTTTSAIRISSSAAPPLPSLNIAGPITISGISSGADFSAQFHVAYSDLVAGSGIFAGQPPGCAVQRFEGDPLVTCANESSSSQGPGCAGMNTTGAAPCNGCPPNTTLLYDHCKQPAWPLGPGWVQTEVLLANAAKADAEGHIAPLANLIDDRIFLFHGTKDTVYMDGSVNRTAEFFAALVSDPTRQLSFVANVPAKHSQPTSDPWLSNASCGVDASWAPPAIENCGFDGAGATLQHSYGGSLTPPASSDITTNPANVFPFNQDEYIANGVWAALASTGYVYIPPACAAAADVAAPPPCRLHVAFHGCGMSEVFPRMNSSFVLHTGYGPWADANNFVILFPQSGGYAERNETAPTDQLAGGCFDGYGQTGPAYAWREGPQMAQVANMIRAIGGAAWFDSKPAAVKTAAVGRAGVVAANRKV